MRTTTVLCLGLLPLVLAGCLSIRKNKSLVITPEPGVTKVSIAAEAVAKCYNLIIVTVCDMDLNLRQVGGRSPQGPQARKVRAFISANYDGIVAELKEGQGPLLAALLKLLQIPPKQQTEAVLRLKELNLQARMDAAEFTALVIENLLNAS
jgi:hypothetical protein